VAAVLVASLIGAVVAFQGRVNGDLTAAGAGLVVASWFSYLGTLLTVATILLVTGRTRHTVALLRERASWWWFAIGLTGIPLVLSMAGGIPLVGIAIASVGAVAGQTVAGLGFDARGIGREVPLPLTVRRALAGLVALCGLGIAVVASGHVEASAWTVAGIGLALFGGGALLCIQTSGSGYLTGVTGGPFIPALTTAIGGMVGITAVAAVSWSVGGLDGMTLPDAGRWYLYLGGPLGAAITVLTAWAVPRLGVFTLTLSVVGGQMLVSIMLDAQRTGEIPWPTVAAAAVVCAAVTLAMPRKITAA